MVVWVCRAGLRGEYENKFVDLKKIFLIGSVSIDLTGKTDMQELMKTISAAYPTEPDGSVVTMSVQARAFASKVKKGDWVIVPNMGLEKLLLIGEITGGYDYDPKKSELKHSHVVDWKYGAWERSAFDDDIIRSVDAFDTFMMFFKLRQDKRIKEIVGKGKPLYPIPIPKRIMINKPENEPIEETEFVPQADNSEIRDLIAEIKKLMADTKRTNTDSRKTASEVRETITEVKKSIITETMEIRKVIEEVKDVIMDVKETITEVKKATLTEAAEVKKVISEVRDAIDAAGEVKETVYVNNDAGMKSGTICCRCDPSYYDVLKTRRRFRR
jgi:hypothetical protein